MIYVVGIIAVFILVLLVTSGAEFGGSTSSARATFSKMAEFMRRGLFPNS